MIGKYFGPFFCHFKVVRAEQSKNRPLLETPLTAFTYNAPTGPLAHWLTGDATESCSDEPLPHRDAMESFSDEPLSHRDVMESCSDEPLPHRNAQTVSSLKAPRKTDGERPKIIKTKN